MEQAIEAQEQGEMEAGSQGGRGVSEREELGKGAEAVYRLCIG